MSETAPREARSYRPRSPQNPLQDIVEENLEELFQTWDARFRKDHGPLHSRLELLFEAFVRCGDPHFGFLRFRCPRCGEEKLLPHSCKARGLCPSCQKKRAVLWAERMVEEGELRAVAQQRTAGRAGHREAVGSEARLEAARDSATTGRLPLLPYVQLVFTIPKMLRPHFLWDRSLYGALSRVAYDATREFFQAHFPGEKAVPAMVISPQSFGSLLNHHPHLHSVCSWGVFDREGKFHQTGDLDFGPLPVYSCLSAATLGVSGEEERQVHT